MAAPKTSLRLDREEAPDYKVTKGLVGAGFTRHWDPKAGAAWLFDGTTWELSGDTADGELIAALAD